MTATKLGMLRGDGFWTPRRVDRSDDVTVVTADVPGEVGLTPPLWVRWQLQGGDGTSPVRCRVADREAMLVTG